MSDSFFEYNNKMFYKSQVTVGHILSYKYAKRPLFTVGYTVYCDGKKNHAIGDSIAIQLYIRNEIHIYIFLI